VRRQRLIAIGVLLVLAAGVGLAAALTSAGSGSSHHAGTSVAGTGSASTGPAATVSTSESPPKPTPPPSAFAVGLRVLTLTDTSRTVTMADGTTDPRTLVTYVRYPAQGSVGQNDLANAPAASAYGPYPLIVFGHGFAVTPGIYSHLLQAWARAGYVVAAPAFPLENADAPGGPKEEDLVNQPADMSFVISSMLSAAASGSGPFSGLIDPTKIAVSGQSDGGDTALAVAYDHRFSDSRVGAAVILSGAEIPAEGSFNFPAGGPPLLATQGTADTVNPPSFTNTFFEAAQRPKYLLSLIGAEHLPPYTVASPQLHVVEGVSLAFLDSYLKHRPGTLAKMSAIGQVPGVASLTSEP
jgi:dienelactone hydrolase